MPLGFGFENAGHTPAIIREVCNFLRYHTPGGVYIVGGVAAHWRSHSRDADRNPEFVDIYTNHFDAISPWTIGRYKDEEEADHFAEQVMKGDIEFLKKKNDSAEMTGEKKIDYIPVVFPGGSVNCLPVVCPVLLNRLTLHAAVGFQHDGGEMGLQWN